MVLANSFILNYGMLGTPCACKRCLDQSIGYALDWCWPNIKMPPAFHDPPGLNQWKIGDRSTNSLKGPSPWSITCRVILLTCRTEYCCSSLNPQATSRSPINQNGTMVKGTLFMEKFISLLKCVHLITRLRELCRLAAALARLAVTTR